MKMNLKFGDCLELMKELEDESINMILCDLPYGTTSCKWDKKIDLKIVKSYLLQTLFSSMSLFGYGFD